MTDNILNKAPKLQIAVPVFNQAAAIRIAGPILEEIYLSRPSEIGILVSDNASRDETRRAVHEAMPSAKYLLQDSNVGMELNMRHLLSSSESEFIWFLGAGDTPTGDIGGLLHTLETADKKVALFIPEYSATDGFASSICEAIWRTCELRTAVLEKARFDNISHLHEEWVGDMWPHVSHAYNIQSRGHAVLKIAGMEQIGYSDSQEWHVKNRMYPFAVDLLKTVQRFAEEKEGLVKRQDLAKVRQTLATWYTQDLFSCKVENKWKGIHGLFLRISPFDLSFRQSVNLVIAQLTPRFFLQSRMRRKRTQFQR
jgi:hypothetical protein